MMDYAVSPIRKSAARVCMDLKLLLVANWMKLAVVVSVVKILIPIVVKIRGRFLIVVAPRTNLFVARWGNVATLQTAARIPQLLIGNWNHSFKNRMLVACSLLNKSTIQ